VNYALSIYPLSNSFRHRLATALEGEPVYLSIAELRSLGPRKAFAKLRSVRGAKLVLPLEDESSGSALPVLTAVAAFANANTIEIRHPDLRAERLSRADVLKSVAALAGASGIAGFDAWRCSRDLGPLLASERMHAVRGESGRALYLNANLWFGVKAGGSIGHVAGVINALERSGCRMTYASAGGRTMIDDSIPLVSLDPPGVFGLPYELNYYRFHRMVVDQLSAMQPPRFIYQRMSVANFAGVVLSRQWRVPLVLEYNGSEAWIAKNWGRSLRYHNLAVAAEDACLRHAHLLVTISDVLRDELIERGVSPERIVTYPNCIDPDVFDPARFSEANRLALRRRVGIPANATVATFIGTFGQWHGVDVLAQAIRQMVDTDPAWLRANNLRFLLVGDGVKMPVVRRILGDACDEFVTLTGLVPQSTAPEYLAASDILLSPHVSNADGSRFFGSPTKLFEYMAMGKPIVASDLDQIGQVLQNSVRAAELPSGNPSEQESRLAVLTAPGDPDGIVKSVQFLAGAGAWRKTLGANARAEALTKYTWTHHTDAILDGLRALGH
jgi:glycosyltransferase involved in cell wall biosynthesis